MTGSRQGGCSMFAVVRFALLGTSLALALMGTDAAGKPFQRNDLTDSAVKLEAQIKQEAGVVTRPVAILKHEADVAFERHDFRAGMQILGQIAALAPSDAGNWLRLARAILKIQPSEDAERTLLLERAATAAYIAYQQTNETAEAADQWYRQDREWAYEPVQSTRRVADGTLDVAVGKPGHLDIPATWGRYRLEVSSDEPAGPIRGLRCRLLSGCRP